MGCTRFVEHWDNGADELLVEAADEAFASAGRDQGRRRRLLARHRPVGDERDHAGPAARARGQAGHPRGELLRDRLRRAAPGRLRRRQRGLRHAPWRSAWRRSRTAAIRASTPSPIPTDGTAPDPDRGGHVLDGRARLRQQYGVDADQMRDGPRPHRVEEPRQRGPQPAGAVPPADVVEQISAMPPVAGHAHRLRLLRRGRRRRRRRSWCGPKTPTATRTRRCTSRRCRWSPATARRSRDPAYDYTTSPRSSAAARTPTRRPGSPTRAASWPWPRSTTASRRPSWS